MKVVKWLIDSFISPDKLFLKCEIFCLDLGVYCYRGLITAVVEMCYVIIEPAISEIFGLIQLNRRNSMSVLYYFLKVNLVSMFLFQRFFKESLLNT